MGSQASNGMPWSELRMASQKSTSDVMFGGFCGGTNEDRSDIRLPCVKTHGLSYQIKNPHCHSQDRVCSICSLKEPPSNFT